MRARPRAHADRLADVDDLARGVAHHVDAGVVGQVGEVGHAPVRAAHPRRRRRSPWPAGASGARGARASSASRTVSRVRAQPREERAEHARARLRVGQRAVGDLDVDPQRLGQRPQAALAPERVQAARERDRAQLRRVGPAQPRALEGLAQHAAVERRAVGHEHAPAQLRGQLGQLRLGRRRLVDHRLGDAGEALDPARERRAHGQQRLPALVQLAPADEHGAHLGQLAGVARQPVRLGVDDEELRGGDGLIEIHPDRALYASHPTERQRESAWDAAGAGVPSRRTRSGRRQRMTTSATRQGTDRTIAEREAWEAYRESLRDLEGADYEEAERDLVGAPAGDAARAERRRHGQLSGRSPANGAVQSDATNARSRLGFAAGRTSGRVDWRRMQMRRTAAHAPLAVAVVLALGGCGSSSADYKNDPRPPGPIVITGYISDQRVSVSPRSFGAGPISLIVTNQTGTAQRVTLESAGATGSGPGIRQVTAPISPQDTATLKVDVKPGQLLGPRGRRRHPRRAPAGSGPSARARRTTCCNRRPPAAASDTIGACRYGLSRRCCASASCSGPAPSRRRPRQQSPQELFRDVLLKDADTTSGVKRLLRTNAGFVSPTPRLRRPHGRRQVRRGGDGRERRRGGRRGRLRPHRRGLRQRRAARRLPQPVALPAATCA